MRLSAYILAADPAWIEASVLSYYDMVNKIIVSYDENSRSWTGTPIPVEECLSRLRAIDRDNKMVYSPGHYARLDHLPMENDTHQRQCALDEAGEDADWVLQLDTDEVLPDSEIFQRMIDVCESSGHTALEWPMRVLFRRTFSGRYLEVCGPDGNPRYEYPGPAAIRARGRLRDARRCIGPFARAVFPGDVASLQIACPLEAGETRLPIPTGAQAILHNSWARDPRSIARKVGAWSHAAGWRSRAYYYLIWLPAPATWRALRDFHPFARGLWPRLRQVPAEDARISRILETALL